MALPGPSGPYPTPSLSDVPYNQKWELLKPHIHRLYVDEDRPLKEVISTMQRDFGFHANETSYKYYINRKWKLRTSIPAAKKAAMVGILQSRAQAGKSTALTYKGKEVDPKKLRRAMKEDARREITMHTATTSIDADAGLISHTVFPAGNRIFLNWNMPYGAMRRSAGTMMGGPSPAAMAASTPSDVFVATPSANSAQSPHNVPSPMTVALKAKTAIDRANLFVQGRHHELLHSLNRVERRHMSTWLYQFWLFSFRTAKNWGRGPRDWTANLLGFHNFEESDSVLSPNSHGLTNTPNRTILTPQTATNPADLPTYPPPSPLCRWAIHVRSMKYEALPDLSAEMPCNPDDEETWTTWGRLSNPTSFEEKLRSGLESNDFSTIRATDLPVAVSQIATAARRSPDELLVEAFGFSIMGRNFDLTDELSKRIDLCDEAHLTELFPFHLATSYLDGSKTCGNLLDLLISRMPPQVSLRKTWTNNHGHTILDNLMIAILKSHTSCLPGLVDDAWHKETRFAGEEVDICGRWDADSDCVRSLLAHGEAVIPFEWKHMFCHTSVQTICHCIDTVFHASYAPDINIASGLFVRRCSICGLKLQLTTLHTLVLTGFAVAQQGAAGEDLFGILACALCLLWHGADASLTAQISLDALWHVDEADLCSHEELSAADLADKLTSQFQDSSSKEVRTGWEILRIVLRSSQKELRLRNGRRLQKDFGIGNPDESNEEDEMEIDSDSEHEFQDRGMDDECCVYGKGRCYFGGNKNLGAIYAAVRTELVTYRRLAENDPWTSINFDMEGLVWSLLSESELKIGLLEKGLMKSFCRCGMFDEETPDCLCADDACVSYFMNMDVWSRATFIDCPGRGYE